MITMGTEGKTTYERISDIINPVPGSVFYMACECQMNGEFDNALRLYQKIVEKEPNNTKALQGIADVFSCMGNHEEALLWYGKALDYDPYNAEIWYNKGLALCKTGYNDEGYSCIRKGISLAMSTSLSRRRI